MSDARPTGPRAEITEVPSTAYASAHELARAFGSVVFEPAWWPSDIEELTYELLESASGPSYHIGSVRTDGRPIVLIGQREDPRVHLLLENWYEPDALKALGGIAAETGAGYRAVLRQEQQTVQLIGYLSEAEVTRAALSLNRVAP
jgi:hypothetical protein